MMVLEEVIFMFNHSKWDGYIEIIIIVVLTYGNHMGHLACKISKSTEKFIPPKNILR